MKRILLTSTAIAAFAGAAAAEVTLSGEAKLGFNDNELGDNYGFYGDLSADLNFSQELDNGITVSASIGLQDLSDGADATEYELAITSDTAGLYYGDTDGAIDAKYSLGGAFDESDVDFGSAGDHVLRGEVQAGQFDVAISYGIEDDAGKMDLTGLQVAANATFGSIDARLGYAEIDGADDLVMLGATTTVGGAELYFDYLTAGDADGYQIGGSYPAGPVTVGAYYGQVEDVDFYGFDVDYSQDAITVSASYDAADDGTTSVDNWAIEGSYDLGNGLTIMAGLVDSGEDTYVAGEYDLGGGATLLVSYADDGDNDDTSDEIGDPEYQEGATVEVSFEF